MSQFIFKVGTENVALASLTDASLKKSFEELKSRIEQEVGSMICTAHHRQLVVILQVQASEPIVAGFGSCCEELNKRAKDALSRLGYDINKWTFATVAKASSGDIMEQAPKKKTWVNVVLWILQALMALAYLNAGYLKTFRPIAEIAPTIFWAPAVPEPLVRFIGVSELLGAIGLILPALLKIRPQLTTLAGAGLTLIMLLANIFHIVRGEFFVLPGTGVFLIVVGFITYGRWKLYPIAPRELAA